MCLETLVRKNRFSLPKVVDLMTRRPADLIGLPAGTLREGAAADICLFDPDEAWVYDAKSGQSKSSNSPWHGHQMRGRVKMTVVGGKIVYSGGKIT